MVAAEMNELLALKN